MYVTVTVSEGKRRNRDQDPVLIVEAVAMQKELQ